MLKQEIEKRRDLIVGKIHSLQNLFEAEMLKNRELTENDARDEIISNLRSENARLSREIDVLAAQIQDAEADKGGGPVRDSLWKACTELEKLKKELEDKLRSSELLDFYRNKAESLEAEMAELRDKYQLALHERDTLGARLKETGAEEDAG